MAGWWPRPGTAVIRANGSDVATFILAVAFYWWTPHILLLGRVAWNRLFPVGVATAVCVTGLGVFRTCSAQARSCRVLRTTDRLAW